jgi:hypothetical protein
LREIKSAPERNSKFVSTATRHITDRDHLGFQKWPGKPHRRKDGGDGSTGSSLRNFCAIEELGRIVVGARESEHILAKFMKDSVVRGCLLQLLYERRSEGSIPFGHAEQAVPPPGGISRRDWLRAVAQLSEYRLIDWTPLEDKSGMGLLSGFAKINDFGVKVLEAGVAPPIRISIDESRRTTVSRQEQASIATSTPQQQAITEALEKVITAIIQADLSEKEKNAAKSLLRKLLGSKAAGNVLGAGAPSLAAKYFTG